MAEFRGDHIFSVLPTLCRYMVVLAILLFPCSGFSQGVSLPPGAANSFIIDNWNTSNGLPSNSLLSLHQSSTGFIWISSYHGVLRFDGSEFVHYNKSNTPIFHTTGVSAIEEDDKGGLWFGTYGGGVLRLTNSHFLKSPPAISDFTIGALYADTNQMLVGTRGHGLFCFRKDSLVKVPEFAALKDFMISAIVRDNVNALWVGTENKGLIRIQDGKLTTFTTDNGLPENKISSFFIDDEDRLWFGTSRGVASIKDNVITIDSSVPACLVKNIERDALGNMWAASECGLFIREKGGKQWREFLNNKNEQLANSIVDVLPSREGDVWVTTYRHGLFRIRYSNFSSISPANGLSAPIVTAVAETGPGRFLIGTDNGKVDVVENGTVRKLVTRTRLPQTRVRHILRDMQGNIWIGTSAGLLKIDQSGKETWMTKNTGLSDNVIRVLFEDREGTLWIGTRAGGITKIDRNGGHTYLNKENGFPSDFIMSIDQDRSGDMWIGSNESGLLRIHNGSVTDYSTKSGLPTNVIFNTYEDKDGVMWIATNSGLVRFRDGKFFTYDGTLGLPNDSPYDILEDNAGNLWIPTTVGVMKIAKENLNEVADHGSKSLEVRLYDHQDGIEEPECTGTTVSLMASDSAMWIPTLNGIIVLDPGKLPMNEENVKVYINHLLLNEEKIFSDGEVALPPGSRRFSIKFSALNLKAPAKVKFRYKLENFDNQWIDIGTRREVYFTNLPPGSYRFIVSARNEDGKWSEDTTALTFTLLPYFWETPLFYFLIVLTLGAVLFGLFRWRVYSIRARNLALSHLVVQQTEELRNINAALADQKEEVERTNEELMTQHNYLAEANVKLEHAHEELLRSNQHLEEKVTERTKDLQTALDKVNRLNEELAVFIYRASHDLKGPAASLIGLALLGKLEGGQESQRYFDRIENTAVSMNKVLSKLINIHGAITRKDLNPEPVVIEDLVRDVHHSTLSKGATPVAFRLECSVHHTVCCDATLVGIILENLIENALIFRSMERDTEIVCRISKAGSVLNIVIEDNGIGIGAENIEKVFDLFYRASENSKGNGLGLYLVKKAVEKMNGSITLESELNRFTRFTVSFSECSQEVLAEPDTHDEGIINNPI